MAFELIGEKVNYVVENVDSKGFFLVLDYADANPGFSRDIDEVSKYASFGIAEIAVDRVRSKGFTMDLKIKPLQTTYMLGTGDYNGS